MKRKRQYPGATAYTDRHGRRRWRFRKGGFSAELGGAYGSEEFIQRYEAAVEQRRMKGQAGSSRTIPGSFSAVLVSWYQSQAFKKLKPNTQRNYRSIMEAFREVHGDKRVSHLRPAHIMRILGEKSETPFAADRLKKLLRQVIKHSIQMGLRADNPVDHIDYTAPSSDGYHTWTEEEIARFYRHYQLGTLAHRAMTLMLYTGAARVDAVRLGWGNVKNGRLAYRRQKTGSAVDVPLHPELASLIDALPRDSFTFLETVHGKSRSPNGLGNKMREWCDKAGLPECTSHGLRKAISVRLANAGASTHEIGAVIGDKSLSMVALYTREADRIGNADKGMERLIEAPEQAQKVANLSDRFVKNDANPLKTGDK